VSLEESSCGSEGAGCGPFFFPAAIAFDSFFAALAFAFAPVFPLTLVLVKVECEEAEITVGGNCFGSPANINFFPFKIGIQQT
jgi:hypothetical protein